MHLHPRLAIERELAVEALQARIGNKHSPGGECSVVDMYGNPNAWRKRGLQVHSNIPHIHSSDLERRAMAPVGWFCEHRPEECNCGPFDVAVAVQALQYIGPEALAKVLLSLTHHIAYSVVHRFVGVAGSFYGKEQTWHRSSAHRVVCSMDGGLTVWEHDALDWLDSPYYVASLGVVIVSNPWTTFGKTVCYSHTLVDPMSYSAPERAVSEWGVASREDDEAELYSLPTAFVGNNTVRAVLSSYKLKTTHIRAWKGIVVMCGEDYTQDVILSSAVVSAMEVFYLAKAHDPAVYRQGIQVCKGHYAAIPNLPPDRLPAAVIATVLLAMVSSATLEVALLTDALWESSALLGTHSSLLEYKQPWSARAGTIGACVASTVVSSVVAYEFPTRLVSSRTVTGVSNHAGAALIHAAGLHVVSSVTIPLFGGLALAVPPVAFAWGVCSSVMTGVYIWKQLRKSGTSEAVARAWLETRPGALPLVRPKAPVPFQIAPRFYATTKLAPVRRIKEDTSLTVSPDPREGKEPEPLLEHKGIAFSAVIPTYYRSGQPELISAVTNRVLMEVPIARKGLWKVVATAYNQTPFQRRYHSLRSTFRSDRQAVIEWIQRYPKRRQAELLEAYDRVAAKGFRLTAKERGYGLFTKTEKQVALKFESEAIDGEEHEPKAPRVIHSMKDEVAVIEGPISFQVSKRQLTVQKSMAEEEDFSLGPRDSSAEAVGTWFGKAVDRCGGPDAVVVIDDDGAKWDAHTGEDQIVAQGIMLFGKLRFDNKAIRSHILNPPKLRAASTWRSLRG